MSAPIAFSARMLRRDELCRKLPPPGVKVRRGWRVRVAESMGPQRVVIPDLSGAASAPQRSTFAAAAWSLEVWQRPSFRESRLIRSWPESACQCTNVSAPKISILVASPQPPAAFVMPDMVGSTEDDAVAAIVGAGLHVDPSFQRGRGRHRPQPFRRRLLHQPHHHQNCSGRRTKSKRRTGHFDCRHSIAARLWHSLHL